MDGNYALKEIFPDLFNNVQNKECYVAKADAKVGGICNSEGIFPIGNLIRVNLLFDKLETVALQDDMTDSLRWPAKTDG